MELLELVFIIAGIGLGRHPIKIAVIFGRIKKMASMTDAHERSGATASLAVLSTTGVSGAF